MRAVLAALSRVPIEARVLIGGLLGSVLALGVMAPMIALAIPIALPVSSYTIIKDQTRLVSPLIPTPVKTISYGKGDYEQATKPKPKVEPKAKKSKYRKRQRRSEIDDGMQLASLSPSLPASVEPASVEPAASESDEPDPMTALASAREYLIETAKPGGTMTRQGPDKALACLHPEFALRLAAAIADARGNGLDRVGIFSGCRPPFLGVGGFGDKFLSLHAYGLAVDISGIGGPGSKATKLWHEIARMHGVVCPYGPYNRAEHNHCQPTSLRAVHRSHPLRQTITKHGPIDLDAMWTAAASVIVSVTVAAKSHKAKPPRQRRARYARRG